MRTSLVFPPSLCLPNPLYLALPLLAASLRRAGHHVRVIDLNALAADRLLTRETVEHLLARAWQIVAEQRGTPAMEPAAGLEPLVRSKEACLLAAPACKETLRDPVRNFDPPAFRDAFRTVVEALDFCYAADPVISPHRPSFARDLLHHVQSDPWTPLRDLYEDVLLDAVLADDPDLVGISVAFPEQAAESVRLAIELRQRRPHTKICIGGPLVTLFPEKWLEGGWLLDFADALVVGDGTIAIVELAEALEGRRPIETVHNLVYRSGAHVRWSDPEPYVEPVDELPSPDFDAADLSLYFTPRPIYPIQTSRGCYWGKCTFCSQGWRARFRMMSPEKIRADVLDLAHRYGARYLYVQDSSIPPRAALELARIVREERLPLYWLGGMRFERAFLNENTCRELSAGGCRSLMIGLESANQRLIDLMGKGFDLHDVPRMLQNLRQAGISIELLWFIGFPSESREEALTTMHYLLEHRSLFGLAAFVGDYHLHPDTAVCEHPQDYGVTITGQENDRCLYASDSGMPVEEMLRMRRLLSDTANRTLVCNGAHLPHVVENGLDLSGISLPFTIPPEITLSSQGTPR
ncbi:MAG: radical SAM protein [Planctomycetota bacterium]